MLFPFFRTCTRLRRFTRCKVFPTRLLLVPRSRTSSLLIGSLSTMKNRMSRKRWRIGKGRTRRSPLAWRSLILRRRRSFRVRFLRTNGPATRLRLLLKGLIGRTSACVLGRSFRWTLLTGKRWSSLESRTKSPFFGMGRSRRRPLSCRRTRWGTWCFRWRCPFVRSSNTRTTRPLPWTRPPRVAFRNVRWKGLKRQWWKGPMWYFDIVRSNGKNGGGCRRSVRPPPGNGT